MKTNLLKNFSATLMLLTLTFLLSVAMPLSARQSKNADRQKEETTQSRDDSSKLKQPTPVADDSPINPAKKNRDNGSDQAKKSDRDKDQQKKKSRR